MTVLPALANALCAAAALPGDVYQLGVSTEARVYPGADAAAADFELDPSAGVSFHLPLWTFDAQYAPRLILDDASGASPSPTVTHSGRLAVERQLEGGGAAGVGEGLTYGTYDFHSLVPLPGASTLPVQPLPNAATLAYVSSQSTANLRLVLSRTVTTSVSGSYLISGGTDAEAQQILPLSQGPLGTATVAVRLDPRWELDSIADGQQAFFSSGDPQWVASATEGVRWRADRLWTLDAAAGIGGDRDGPLPVARAGVERSGPPGIGLTAGARVSYGPFLDRVLALAYPRLEATASAGWAATEKLTFDASTSVAQAWSAAVAANPFGVFASTGSTWHLSEAWTLRGGLRAAWQREAGVPLSFWTAFLGVAYVAKGEL